MTKWLNLLFIFLGFVLINVILLREHFTAIPGFSESLFSMITVNPGSPFSLGSSQPTLTTPPLFTTKTIEPTTGSCKPVVPPAPSCSPPPAPAPSCLPVASAPADCSVPTSPVDASCTTGCAEDSLMTNVQKQLASDVNASIQSSKLSQLQQPIDVMNASLTSDSTTQGQDFSSIKSAIPPIDMSEYIRKDEIPCWGCSIP